MEATAGLVLDASALLAYLRHESGHELVRAAVAARAVINVVNYAEVLSRLSEVGEDPTVADRRFRDQGLVGDLVEVVPLNAEDAVTIARLRASTRAQGLSLGDRACLATGLRLDRPVLTADRRWELVDIGVAVRLIRR